jgi:branched-subunit amino acid transport protein AzlD
MNYVKSVFAAGTKDSLMRFLSAFIVFDVVLSWNIACLFERKFLDIPYGVGAILTAAILGKAVQKFGEKGGKD